MTKEGLSYVAGQALDLLWQGDDQVDSALYVCLHLHPAPPQHSCSGMKSGEAHQRCTMDMYGVMKRA